MKQMITRTIKFIFIGALSLITLNVNAQTEILELKDVKELLSGNWKGDKRISTFRFKNDSTGLWEVENIISTAPLFIIYKEHDKCYVGSIDILGNGEPYPYEIVILNKKELVLKDQSKGTLLKFKRK